MTTLCNLWLVAPLISYRHYEVYHYDRPPSSLFLPSILNFWISWLVLTLLLVATQRWVRGRIAVWSSFVIFLPTILVKTWVTLVGWNSPLHPTRVIFAVCSVVYLLYLLIVTFWLSECQPSFDQVQKVTSQVLSSVAIVGVLILCQLLWFDWQARALNEALPLHTSNQTAAMAKGRNERLIWIVFDELSYQQVYEDRAKGLALPTFDRLAAESTVFSHVIPAGNETAMVLPSLITGHPVSQMSSSADGRILSLYNPETRVWKHFDQHDTTFQDALNAHYRTAVAGWYNPYCRILPEVLDQCYWSSHFLEKDRSIKHLLSRTFHSKKSDEREGALHVADYRELSAAADQMLKGEMNFVLIHLPIPHPDGIYHRTTGELTTTDSTYLDNLALADKCLAHIWTVLEEKGEWNSSTVVLMGDHSWRTKLLWMASSHWTREEQVASHGGQFDDRPAYVVKLPNQQLSAKIDLPFPALRTRSLMQQIINGRIATSQQLDSWTRTLTQTK